MTFVFSKNESKHIKVHKITCFKKCSNVCQCRFLCGQKKAHCRWTLLVILGSFSPPISTDYRRLVAVEQQCMKKNLYLTRPFVYEKASGDWKIAPINEDVRIWLPYSLSGNSFFHNNGFFSFRTWLAYAYMCVLSAPDGSVYEHREAMLDGASILCRSSIMASYYNKEHPKDLQFLMDLIKG